MNSGYERGGFVKQEQVDLKGTVTNVKGAETTIKGLKFLSVTCHPVPPSSPKSTMPKIVSKSTVSSSDQQGNNDNSSSNTKLHVYYCLCSEFILVIDHDLQQLPRRHTDKSYIVANAGRTFKLTVEQGETTIIRREEGYEKQHRLVCPRKF
jgi:hypothetical protein